MMRRIGRRKPSRHPDPVTPALWMEVMAADGGRCVARQLDPDAGDCRGKWGDPFSGAALGTWGPISDWLTLDHVQSGYGRMGKRAPSDRAHLVTLCWWHHVRTGWATSHKALLREYIEKREAAA